jgi:hypothetical protein
VRHDPEIDLHALERDHAHLRVAASDRPADHRQIVERVHHGLDVVRSGKDVDVADRLAHPTEGPAVRDLLDGLALGEAGYELFRQRQGDVELDTVAVLLELLDVAGDVLLGLGAEAFDAAELVLADRDDELVDARDPELLIEEDRLLGSQARDAGQLPNAGRDQLAQVL